MITIILLTFLAVIAFAIGYAGYHSFNVQLAELRHENSDLRKIIRDRAEQEKFYSASYTVTESDYLDKKRTVPMVAKSRICKQLAMSLAKNMTRTYTNDDGYEVYYISILARPAGVPLDPKKEDAV